MPLYLDEVDEAIHHASILFGKGSVEGAFTHLLQVGLKIGLKAAAAQAEFEHDHGGNALAASTAIQQLFPNSYLLLLASTRHPRGS